MNIRGIVSEKLGNRLFLRPSTCDCDQCPKLDLTQAKLQVDFDSVNIGDKMESYTGSMWYKVEEWTPNEELDLIEEMKEQFYQAHEDLNQLRTRVLN